MLNPDAIILKGKQDILKYRGRKKKTCYMSDTADKKKNIGKTWKKTTLVCHLLAVLAIRNYPENVDMVGFFWQLLLATHLRESDSMKFQNWSAKRVYQCWDAVKNGPSFLVSVR